MLQEPLTVSQRRVEVRGGGRKGAPQSHIRPSFDHKRAACRAETEGPIGATCGRLLVMAIKRSSRLPLSALLAASIGLSACGGATSASPHRAGTSSEQNRLAEVSLRQSDLPAGWTSKPDPLTSAAQAALKAESDATASCMGITNPWIYKGTTTSQSRIYASPQPTTLIASTSTQELPSTKDVALFLGPYANPAYPRCKGIAERSSFQSALQKSIANVPELTVSPITVTIQPPPTLTGPMGSSIVTLNTFDVNVSGTAPIPVSAIRLVLTRGRVIVQLSLEATGVALSTSLFDHLARTLYLRMSGASSVTV
jgi:hypothetical protein